jgi:molecular chaperone Hsp33
MAENPTIGLVKHQDLVQPFMLHNSIVRGRMVRLDDTLNEILSAHQYPEPVALLLAELLLLSSMLATQLPEGGILTLQIKTEGAVSFMVCDVLRNGGVRGYANVVDSKAINDDANMQQLLGRGYLAITLDTTYGEPYQGIVPLEGDSISEAVAHYFSQSQQLHVLFRNYIGKIGEKYIASGIMLERMPEPAFESDKVKNAEFQNDANDAQNWDYYKLLLATATKIELTDLYLAPSALLYRLFNEGGVWVYDTHKISKNCRCSRDKISKILGSMPEAELVEMQVDGAISVVCQFCNKEELFTLIPLK